MIAVYASLALALCLTFIAICLGFALLAGAALLFSKSRKEEELAASIRVERMLQELRITAFTKISSQVPPPPPASPPSGKRGGSSKNFSIVRGPNDGPGKNN